MVVEPPRKIEYLPGGYLLLVFQTGSLSKFAFEKRCGLLCNNGECFILLGVKTCVCPLNTAGKYCEMKTNYDSDSSIERYLVPGSIKYEQSVKHLSRNICNNDRNLRLRPNYESPEVQFVIEYTPPFHKILSKNNLFFAVNNTFFLVDSFLVAFTKNALLYYVDLKLQTVADVILNTEKTYITVLGYLGNQCILTRLNLNGHVIFRNKLKTISKFGSLFKQNKTVYLVLHDENGTTEFYPFDNHGNVLASNTNAFHSWKTYIFTNAVQKQKHLINYHWYHRLIVFVRSRIYLTIKLYK